MNKEKQEETANNLRMLCEFGASLAMFREEQWNDINNLLLHLDDALETVAFFQYVAIWADRSNLSPQDLGFHLAAGVQEKVTEALNILEDRLRESPGMLDGLDVDMIRCFYGNPTNP